MSSVFESGLNYIDCDAQSDDFADTNTCYQRIRDLREDADLKQKDIANILTITNQQYSLYERGDREIPLHHIITLAKFYNVSLDYLTGLTNKKKSYKE